MTSAAARGWGDPDDPGYEARNIKTVYGGGIRLRVHRLIARRVQGLLNDIAKVWPLAEVADDWGYNNRDIRGRPGVKSNHAWGLAVDLNATVNPMTSDPDARREFDQRAEALARKWGFEWGGGYDGRRKDYMHFEFVGSPAEAANVTVPDTQAEETFTVDAEAKRAFAELRQFMQAVASEQRTLKTMLAAHDRHLIDLAAKQGVTLAALPDAVADEISGRLTN